MPTLLERYPFRQTRDLRTAMTEALCTYLTTISYNFPVSRHARTLAAIYPDWPTFEQRAMSAKASSLPAAAVLPDRIVYDASSFTPRIVPETWMHEGHRGLALFAVSEGVAQLLVIVRAVSKPQRQALVAAIERAFIETGTWTEPQPIRYGKILEMPNYFNRKVRITLRAQQLLDSEALAKENRWLAQFELEAHAQQVVLRSVPPLDVRVQTMVDGETVDR